MILHDCLRRQALELGATRFSRAYHYDTRECSSVHFFREATEQELKNPVMGKSNGLIEVGFYVPAMVRLNKRVHPITRINPIDSALTYLMDEY